MAVTTQLNVIELEYFFYYMHGEQILEIVLYTRGYTKITGSFILQILFKSGNTRW